MSAFTIELFGTMFLYLGYLYFTEKMKVGDNKYYGALYYGALSTALSFSTYNLTGGAFNLAAILGSIIFDCVLEVKYIALFFGALIGAFISVLLY